MIKEVDVPLGDISCPLCGGNKIILVRGEINNNDNFQECKCAKCKGDFVVSYSVLRK